MPGIWKWLLISTATADRSNVAYVSFIVIVQTCRVSLLHFTALVVETDVRWSLSLEGKQNMLIEHVGVAFAYICVLPSAML